MAYSDHAAAFRCPIDCCVRCTKFSLRPAAVRRKRQESFGDRRTGSEERARATQRLYRHRRKTYQIAWESSKSFCTPILRRW